MYFYFSYYSLHLFLALFIFCRLNFSPMFIHSSPEFVGVFMIITAWSYLLNQNCLSPLCLDSSSRGFYLASLVEAIVLSFHSCLILCVCLCVWSGLVMCSELGQVPPWLMFPNSGLPCGGQLHSVRCLLCRLHGPSGGRANYFQYAGRQGLVCMSRAEGTSLLVGRVLMGEGWGDSKMVLVSTSVLVVR